jgi:hypothetical protein
MKAIFRGLEIKTGDRLKVQLSKPSKLFQDGLTEIGIIVFDQAAFCLKIDNGNIITLRNFNDQAILTIIKDDLQPKNQLDLF